MINDQGNLMGISKMVHIAQARDFYEQDYYTPSDEGFRIYKTPFGNIGIVICFDRHLPESIRSCAMQGAELVTRKSFSLRIFPQNKYLLSERIVPGFL